MSGAGGTMSWHVELMQSEDAAQLARLHAACFDRGWSETEVAACAKDPRCVVVGARRGGELAGMMVCRHAADEAEILTFAVAPEQRRQGIGRALMGEAARRIAAKGARRIFLEVEDSNAAARTLYERAGGKRVGWRPGYYASGDTDAEVFAIALDGDGNLVDAL